MIDRRYTVRLEYCGHAEKRWVVRFCGDWVGETRTRDDSLLLVAEHSTQRRAAF